jgi:hypothetical protein
MRERINFMQYNLKIIKITSTEIIFFIYQNTAQPSGMQHPRAMGVSDAQASLSMQANARKVCASRRAKPSAPCCFCIG